MLLERRMQEILAGKRRGKKALWLLSLLYRMGATLRHQAYRFHLLPSKKVPAVVISVGNVVAGGSGKTPLVHLLARQLSEHYSVAILSRGYRSKAEQNGQPLLVDPSMDAADVGDEPLWLAQKLPQTQVWVSPHRFASAQKAIDKGAEILILDDGFQHRKLQRDFDIVVVAGEQPFSNGHFLPRGYLRDLPSRLREATFLAVMGSFSTELPFPQVVFERTSPLNLQGKKVALFCAIANPERFIQQVQAAGAQIVVSMIKSDHSPFSAEEIEALAQQSKADALVCTEKDYVKLSSMSTSIPLIPVPLELKLKEGEEVWNQFIKNIQSQVDHVRRVSSHAS